MTKAAPDLYFALNSHTLDARKRRTLARVARGLQDLLHDFPDLIIVIEGYSDDRGLLEYNDRLAVERAAEVWRFLRNLGFPEERLQAVSFGDRAAECRPHDDAFRQNNRRVHFRAAQATSSDAMQD